MIEAVLISGITVIVYMFGWFVAAILKKDNSIADIAWGLGFIVIALVSLCLSRTNGLRQLIVTALVIIWATRLSGYIFYRNRGRGEDPRYVKLRAEWGKKAVIRSLTHVFMLQGVLMLIIAYPVILINTAVSAPLNGLVFLGLFVWATGSFFETTGDYQLSAFKKDPANKGRVITTGLWKYSRHPNYFGEVVVWWGIFIIALSIPYGWTGIVSPITITFLLVKVSGIPMLEQRYKDNPEFKEYARRTSIFIPWIPGK